MNRRKRDYLKVFFKGMGMGAADIVPGVSGGTIALITGIYEEFINSLKSFSSAFQILFSEGIKATWKHVNGNFLLALFLGIALSILTFGKLIKYLLAEHPILLWSFFLGLIIASSIFVGKQVKKWHWKSILAVVLGTALIFYLTSISPAETSIANWFIFLSGALAICAMLLPGISGAFILVLLGKYAYVIEALSSLNFKVIGIFILGCLTGLLSFSHFLSFMLKRYYNVTIALLTGFMIGSLNKIWPWKNTLEWGVDRHGMPIPALEENVLPMDYTMGEPMVLGGIISAFVGFALIFILEKTAALKEDKE